MLKEEFKSESKNFWQLPAPYFLKRKEKWEMILFFSLFTPLFLIIFQPFGVNNYDPTHRLSAIFLWSMLGFGGIAFLSFTIFEFLLAPLLFRQVSRRLFIARVLLELILLSSMTFLYYNFLGEFHDWYWRSYLGFIRDVSLMAILPYTLLLLFFSYRQTRRAVSALQRPLQQNLIWLEPDHGSDRLGLDPEQLLYIEAQDNYVAVFHLQEEQVKKSLLRTTMKKLENQLRPWAIIRCHRSYLVNAKKIRKVSGNAQQLQIQLHHSSNLIPVSRSYVKRVQQQLDTHPR